MGDSAQARAERRSTVDQEKLCFIEFVVDNQNRFESLCRVFNALKHDKQNQLASEDEGEKEQAFRGDDEWLEFFDVEAKSHFRRSNLDRDKSWSLPSLIFAFQNGEYELVACRMVSSRKARLEFYPFAFPYGGTGCMKALIEAFGFPIAGENDGTGYVEY